MSYFVKTSFISGQQENGEKKSKPEVNSSLPGDIGVEFSQVHLSGDDDLICDYERRHDESCFSVDWRGEFDELFEDINCRFSDRQVSLVQPSCGFKMTFRCGIKQASCRSCCRMEALNAIDKFLRGAKEEIRFVTDSLGSDRVAVMVKPVIWWKTMDKHFKAEMKKTYAKMKDVKVV